MTEIIRHNTQALEIALDDIGRRAALPALQAEATLLKVINRSVAIKRLATGVAIGIASLGIGYGIHLILRDEPSLSTGIKEMNVVKPDTSSQGKPLSDGSDLSASTEAESMEAGPPETPTTAEPAIPIPSPRPAQTEVTGSPRAQDPSIIDRYVTTNFSVFRSTTQLIASYDWTVTAGHEFATEAEQATGNWASAWCYTERQVDGLTIKLDLAVRAKPYSTPNQPPIRAETLEALNLKAQQIQQLAEACPWYDGKKISLATPRVDPKKSQPTREILPDTDAEPKSVVPPSLEQTSPNPLPQGSLTVSFDRRNNFDLPGNDLLVAPIRDVSLDDCESYCINDNRCLAVTYNKKARVCFLKSGASNLSANTIAISSIKQR